MMCPTWPGYGARFDNAGPGSYERRTGASLIIGGLVFSVWCVAGIGPSRAERTIASKVSVTCRKHLYIYRNDSCIYAGLRVLGLGKAD